MAGSKDQAEEALARERTVLAWNRSGLAVAVCVAVLLRHLWPIQGTGQRLALGLIAAAGFVWAVALLARTAGSASRDDHVLLGPGVLRLVTAATVILAVVAFVLGFLAAP